MSIGFVNRICPNCKKPNYMIFLGDFSKIYKYKCLNCNRYFNDIDFEKDMVEVVRCKDCQFYKEGENEIDAWMYCSLHSMNTQPDNYCSWAAHVAKKTAPIMKR